LPRSAVIVTSIRFEPHVLILYVKGRTAIHRAIAGAVEREEFGPGDMSLQVTAMPTWWAWSSAIDLRSPRLPPPTAAQAN
jgi:hypothetical protein